MTRFVFSCGQLAMAGEISLYMHLVEGYTYDGVFACLPSRGFVVARPSMTIKQTSVGKRGKQNDANRWLKNLAIQRNKRHPTTKMETPQATTTVGRQSVSRSRSHRTHSANPAEIPHPQQTTNLFALTTTTTASTANSTSSNHIHNTTHILSV